jgi:hypothetical protein
MTSAAPIDFAHPSAHSRKTLGRLAQGCSTQSAMKTLVSQRHFAPASRDPDKLFAVRGEHRKCVELIGCGDALEARSIQIDQE